MKAMRFILVLVLLSCGDKTTESNETVDTPTPKKQRPLALDSGKFFQVDDRRMLYGGPDSTQHFDITGYTLKDEQFHYGIGREAFPALLDPLFVSIEEADSLWLDEDRFLVAYKGADVKAYSVKDLTRHEVVNDVLDGEPIMAAYCILADLGAIYERTYGSEELTFALSGYTYFDPEVWDGLDGFVFWDRETESLWWPLIGKAVSGPLQGARLLEMDKAHWADVTWKDVKSNYPNAKVLQSGQDFPRPSSWERTVDAGFIVENFSE